MKDFQLLLNSPNQGFYVPGMTVTGAVLAITDKSKDYEAIEVSIRGFAFVQWYVSTGADGGTIHYTSAEDFLFAFVYVWNKARSADNGQFPTGSSLFPFSLRLVGKNLPSSYESPISCIIAFYILRQWH